MWSGSPADAGNTPEITVPAASIPLFVLARRYCSWRLPGWLISGWNPDPTEDARHPHSNAGRHCAAGNMVLDEMVSSGISPGRPA